MFSLVIRHDCERRTVWGENQQEGRGGKEKLMGRVNVIEVQYIYIYENNVMKPTKNLKREGERIEKE
jgi:hypothetical protein